MPLELATAIASASVENEPKAVTPASSAAAMTARTPSARSSGLAWAVRSDQPSATGSGRSADGRPAQSSSSSTFAAIAAARSTRAPTPSSSTRPDDATPTRRPLTNRRLTNASALATFWWISELANRVSADSPATTSASASPAPAASAAWMTCSASRSASSGSPPMPCSRAHPITPTRTLRNRPPETPWPDVARLPGLALAAVRRAPHPPARGVADGVHRPPQLVRDAGVGAVPVQLAGLAALDLAADLGRELEVQAPVVDRPAAVGLEQEAVVGVGDDVVEASCRRAAAG